MKTKVYAVFALTAYDGPVERFLHDICATEAIANRVAEEVYKEDYQYERGVDFIGMVIEEMELVTE